MRFFSHSSFSSNSHLFCFSHQAYTLPDKYFINCGSDSNATVAGRIFISYTNSGSYSSPGQSSSLKATNASTDTSPLYQTARIFKDPSSYELNISENGTYVLRLHFQAFPSPVNLSDALFNVMTSNFLLLSNFRVPNSSNSPLIKEFLLTINVRKFKIHFTPSQETSLAFVNAMEVFLAPESFIPSNASHVTPAGSNGTYNGLLSHLVLYPVHRINVGGPTITPEDDTLWRNWIPDDAFLYYQGVAGNSASYDIVNYQAGGATEYTAPDLVYRTSKYFSQDFYTITWRFAVSKNARHFVRVHFCDIISSSFNVLRFNLYICSSFSQTTVGLNELNGFYFAVPFYYDFVVDSDSSGFMNISIGPRENSWNKTAYLNGLEIMELMGWDAPMQSEQNRKRLFVIVGSVVGGHPLML
ncbi:hypothetical protein L1049_011314 [Liquidambar formosana]|uniref:Malectin-like domain-containing protein n=1 Tax=Liquidambar formosana TaxID=63359 RepID=A0AAP0RXL7_LIQFO